MSYIGASPTTAAFPFDQFSGNGTTTTFTLTYAPAGATSIIVSISGVVQNPNTYSVIGTTLTLSPAPPIGTSNIAVLYLGLPVIGVSSPGNTAYRTAQDFTATAGQTVFTPSGSYTPGFVDVYRNGARFGAADFTATNGTSVTLVDPCVAGDLVTIVYFTLVSIANAIPQSGGTFTGGVAGTTFTGTAFTGTSFAVPTGTLYPLVSGTAVASTSGTSIDFTGIPSWVRRVTVLLNGVSTNGTSTLQIQIGSGSFSISGYVSIIGAISSANVAGYGSLTTGYFVANPAAATDTVSGSFVLSNITGNTWNFSGTALRIAATSVVSYHAAVPFALGGTLDRVRITTANGTDTFDAGSINILWE